MRAILIDPFAKTVTETDFNGDYKNIYDLIDCQCFTVVGINNRDAIFVDDEGLYVEDQAFFLWAGYGQPLAGKGLILGCDDEGKSISPKTSLHEAQEKVRFVEVELDGWDDIPDDAVTGPDHPMGAGVPIIGSYPVFRRK